MAMRELLDETLTEWTRERPDLDLTAMATFLRLNQFLTLAMTAVDEVFAPLGISLGEFDVLAALRRGGPACERTPTTLARVAMVSPAGMTSRLNRLEAAGLLVRRPDPEDRRGSRVALTPAGVALADRAVELLSAGETELLRGVSATDQRRLDRVLDHLIARLDAAGEA